MGGMKKAALIYNRMSGRRRYFRGDGVEHAAAVLRSAGVEAVLIPTLGPGTAGALARQAGAEGCDVVLACGGDGTVHEVLQGIVGTQMALGVIPMGTANVLAHDLGIPRHPRDAARSLFTSECQQVSVGKVEYTGPDGKHAERYFLSAAGAGPDAELMYRLETRFKRSLGMPAYVCEAARLFVAHPYPMFDVCVDDRRERVSQMLAVRIAVFGSLVRCLAPGADLRRNDFRVILVKSQRRWPYFVYSMGVMLRRCWVPKEVELLHTKKIECGPSADRCVYVEADGEVLGTLPARFSLVPDACVILAPNKTQIGRTR